MSDLDELSPLRFFAIWVTPPATFSPRFHRSLESVFKHHPTAHLDVLSNSLPTTFFHSLTSRTNHSIKIRRYDLASLTKGTRAEVWYAFRRFWSRSAFFPNHEADLLRLLWLAEHGGVYLDTDVVLTRPLRLAHVASTMRRRDDEAGAPPVLRDGAIGIESYGRVALEIDGRADAAADATVQLEPPATFYPMHWAEAPIYTRGGEPTAQSRLWRTIERRSYAVHLWNRKTATERPAEGSVVDRLLGTWTALPSSSAKALPSPRPRSCLLYTSPSPRDS